MSLFVGRLNDRIRQRELEDLFKKYGTLNRCDVKVGATNSFAFVTFADERDAEDAKKALHGTELEGCKLNIEWAKESGRYNGRSNRSRGEFNCYECGRPGHMARDCRERRRHSRSRSRDRDKRRRRSRSGSKTRDRRRRSRSRSKDRSSRRDRSRSRERSKDRSRDRSRSKDRARNGSVDRNGKDDRAKDREEGSRKESEAVNETQSGNDRTQSDGLDGDE